ncbi:hypothetical protein [Streptomyces sp. NPDC018693]|uniref:hypothetical protein n=1 Tax=unclassified Streptomyces TaxID=2593676 RepID=UPI0037BA91E2
MGDTTMHTSTLPTHPVTGARALGWRKARPGEDEDGLYPVWPILGAADDDDDGQDDDTDDSDDDQDDDAGDGGDDSDDDQGDGTGDDGGGQDDDADEEGADALGDKGKRALASMKGKWRTERDKRRELERRLAEKDAGNGGANDADTIRRQAEAAATVKANARIIRSEVRAAAAGKLADPKDALTFLDLGQFEVNEDGEVDADEISEAIDDLIKSKPYLAAAQGSRPRFQGTGDGGAARKASRPKQLTEQDLKTMTPEEIDKAAEDGRLDTLLKGG